MQLSSSRGLVGSTQRILWLFHVRYLRVQVALLVARPAAKILPGITNSTGPVSSGTRRWFYSKRAAAIMEASGDVVCAGWPSSRASSLVVDLHSAVVTDSRH
ncbi:hypothetical protein C2845_PM03G00820 [Panicum miliaceum]|uniref:Uncharacterized protein n=1 Tax=Panicum miliaceum TaxID=4540 RepID=A0A3L6TFL6_PANMI|nr:hypothetical protein C2845_PM03G00820 [Panicum miliaceum]